MVCVSENKKKFAHLQPETLPTVMFRICSMFVESLKKYPNVRPKLSEFMQAKTVAPTMQFGRSDTLFAKNSVFGAIPKLAHAHLTHDLSVVYTISGSNPKYIDLYGIFSHTELGTSWTPDINAQKRIVKKFKNQDFG